MSTFNLYELTFCLTLTATGMFEFVHLIVSKKVDFLHPPRFFGEEGGGLSVTAICFDLQFHLHAVSLDYIRSAQSGD